MAVSSKYRFLKPEDIARFKNMNILARQVVEGFISGLHKSPFHGFSVEFAEHREYTPGDNTKYLDWLALARTDRYYIKQFEEETNMRGYIILDTSGSMGYKSDGLSKFEYGCFLSAVLSYLMIRQQDSVGLVTLDEKIRNRIPPHSSTAHLNLMLRTLEKVTPGAGTNLADNLHKLAEYFKKRSLVVIISDLYDDEKEVVKALQHFRHKKHEVIVFHLFDKNELEFPFDKLTDFIDMETRQRIQIEPAYVREEYLKQIKEFTAYYRRSCSESLIEYVITDTSLPYDFMLSAYLNKRGRLG